MSPATRAAPPLSLTRRWDKAKWHGEVGPDAPHSPSRHILVALRFLDERGQLTASGKRELRGEAGVDAAILARHVRAGAQAFLDESYDAYLTACDTGRTPPRTLLACAWADYERRYDPSRRPIASPFQLLIRKHAAEDPSLEGLLEAARGLPGLASLLADVADSAPTSERPRIETFLEASRLARGNVVALIAETKDPAALLEVLGYVADPNVVEATARLARLVEPGPTTDAAIARALNWRPRRDWLALPASDQRRLRDAVHRVLATDPLTALCALRTVANAASLKLVSEAGEFADEGIIETYKATRTGMKVAKVERGYDDLRRAIAKVAKVTARPRPSRARLRRG